MTQPPAALDHVLARTRHLLIDFDGPICDFYPGQSTRAVADQLREQLRDQDVAVPDDIARSGSPIEVLAYSATVSPDLAASIEAELTSLEVTAATSAIPSAHVPDFLIACRDSGRTVTVTSPSSTPAIDVYLARHDLGNLVNRVIGRIGHSPDLSTSPVDLIELAVDTLHAEPSTCTMLSGSPVVLESAHATGIASIGYASKAGEHEQLATAGFGAIATSLADLTLRLRAKS